MVEQETAAPQGSKHLEKAVSLPRKEKALKERDAGSQGSDFGFNT